MKRLELNNPNYQGMQTIATTTTTTTTTNYPAFTMQERRQWLYRYIEEYGRWNLNVTQTAKQFQVHENTIYKDIESIKGRLDIIDFEDIKFEGNRALKKFHRTCMQKINSNKLTEFEKARWTEIGLHVLAMHNKFITEYSNQDLVSDNEKAVTWKDMYDAAEKARERMKVAVEGKQ